MKKNTDQARHEKLTLRKSVVKDLKVRTGIKAGPKPIFQTSCAGG
jgi:hypothetical protein